MVELGVRLLIAGALLFVAGAFGLFGFDLAWKASAAIAAVGLFGYQVELKGLKNPGVAGFFAVADAYTVALLLGAVGKLEAMGFLVLAPCAYAAARHRANPSSMAPIAASALLVSNTLFHQGSMPGSLLLVQTAGILLVGLLLNQAKIVVVHQAAPVDGVVPLPQIEEDGVLQLRESYRCLRDAYRDLERKSRRDRLVAQLDEVRGMSGERFYPRLCDKLKEMTGADEVALYTLAQFADTMVVRATTADYPKELKDAAFEVDLDRAPGQIKHSLEKAMLTLKGESERARVANILLNERGRIVGMLCVTHLDPERLDECRERATEIAPFLTGIIAAEARRETEKRRLRETELLYEVACVGLGAANETTLAARVSREVWEMLTVDHVGVYLLDGAEAVLASHQGVSVRLLESLHFDGVEGIDGWLRAGAPEIVMFDARDDARCPTQEALKRRVGSFVLLPLQTGADPVGYLTVATHSRGGIDEPELESLRVVAAELSQSLGRLRSDASSAEGIMTPREFAARLSGSSGCLVYLEPLRKDQLADSFGKPALTLALRKFIVRLRRKLPAGACICRRDEGDYVVYLPSSNEGAAASWANDVAATAAMIGVRTPDGTARIPLALRAKVAVLGRQEDQIIGEMIV